MRNKRLYFAVILFPLSLIYGTVVFFRNLLFDLGVLKSMSFKLPVISVGNITVGGTGKTPHVEYLAALLGNRYRTAVLSRGYKRKSRGFQLADEGSMVEDTGDELLQIKKRFPEIIVAADRKRVHGINRLTLLFPELRVIMLDDAFQHRRVNPGLSIVLVDYNRPVFKDFLLPLGNLRESKRNINRAEMVIVSKCPPGIKEEQRQEFVRRLRLWHRQPVFFTFYHYDDPVPVFNPDAGRLFLQPGKHNNPAILMVTGIADAKPLQDYLSVRASHLAMLNYKDHHTYTTADILFIEQKFNELPQSSRIIITTAKDAVKFRELKGEWQVADKYLYYLPIRVSFLDGGEKAFNERIMNFLNVPVPVHLDERV